MRQDISEHAAPVGTLIDALNVRFTTVNEVESRPGTNALSMANDAHTSYVALLSGGPGALGRVPNGFYIGAKGFGFRYDFGQGRLFQSASYANAEPLGIVETIAREENPNASVAVPWPLSQAAQNGYYAVVYSNGNGQGGNGPTDGVMLLKVFTEAGAAVTEVQISNISAAWVVKDGSGTTVMILVTQDLTTGLFAQTLTTSSSGVTLGAPVAVGTLNSSTSFWAPCYWPGIGWAVVYQTAAGTMTINKLAGTASAATQTFAVTGTAPVSCYADATNLYVGWRESSGPSTAVARVYNTALALTSGVGAVTLGAADTDYGPPLFGSTAIASSAMYAVTRSASTVIASADFVQVGTLSAAGVATNSLKVYQCACASMPFGDGYLWVRAGGVNSVTSHSFHRELMLDFMSLRAGDTTTPAPPVIALSGVELFINASSATYQAGWYRQHLGTPAQLTVAGTWIVGIPRIVREEDKLAVSGSGLALAEWLNFTTDGRRQCTPLYGLLGVAGFPTFAKDQTGSRYYINGTQSVEAQHDGIDLGFPFPPTISGSLSVSTGSLTASSTYQWRCVIERIDEDGRRWRSAPSEVCSLQTSATTNTAAMSSNANVAWLRAGWNSATYTGSFFVVHFYRTLANGDTFYRSTPPQGAPTTSGTGVFTFTDGISDTLLAQREILYTDGGVLPNDCPPSCRFIRATEDRVWLAGLWQPEQLQSSKVLVPGEPPQFSDSPAFKVVLPEPCTGIAVQDGNLIAFTKSAIYVVQGFGPNDQGQGEWGTPRAITRSSGCMSHLSILETSIGVFFQSAEGIELLPRGLGEPQFIGMPVQDEMYSTTAGAVMTVIGASVVTTFRGRTARFVLDDGATVNNTLVYDLDMQCWSRDTYGSAVSGIIDTDQGAVLPLRSMSGNFGALQEDLSRDLDSVGNGSALIASSLVWADVRPYGVAGQGRFTGATGLFDAKDTPSNGYQAGNATIKLSVDSRTEQGRSFLMTSLTETQAYQRVVPLNDVGSSAGLTLATAVAGWRFMGWTLETDDSGGSRRMGETEQG